MRNDCSVLACNEAKANKGFQDGEDGGYTAGKDSHDDGEAGGLEAGVAQALDDASGDTGGDEHGHGGRGSVLVQHTQVPAAHVMANEPEGHGCHGRGGHTRRVDGPRAEVGLHSGHQWTGQEDGKLESGEYLHRI